MKRLLLSLGLLLVTASLSAAGSLKPGVRGLITRAPKEMKIDGNLEEFRGSFCTPVNYFHPKVKDRAAQFFYMWDEEAFYCGLRTLDTARANFAPDDKLWEGDGVEWYFDTRRGADFRAKSWGPGAVHMYWVGYKEKALKPRWCLRPDMLKAIPGEGVEVAARDTESGSEIEFKLPWKNFPDFKPAVNEVIALDSELCYSDGAGRVDRTFAYGSPLSVQQPASQGMVQLVEKLEPAHWKQCGPVMMPVRCDTPWTQPTKALVTGRICLPPDHADQIGKILFRTMDLDGTAILDEVEGKTTKLADNDNFLVSEAQWPTDDAAVPGAHWLVAIVYDKQGKELARVAPRLVSVGMQQGY
jgi:hypothetical protein